MIHMVFMKFPPGVFDGAAERDFSDTFSALREALPSDILSARVLTNCVARPQNMDVLILLDLAGPASLPRYLEHPLHQAIGRRYNPLVQSIASFDTESLPGF